MPRIPRSIRLASRPTLAALSLALWAALAPSAARADYWRFAGPPADAGAVTLFANGNFSGVVPIDGLYLGEYAVTTPAHVVTAGALVFNPGLGNGGSPAEGWNFRYGGSFSVVGSLDGGEPETLLDCVRMLNGGFLYRLGPSADGAPGSGRYGLDVEFVADLAPDLAKLFGAKVVMGDLGLTFDAVPGQPGAAGATAYARFEVASATPEPGSLGMLAGGLAAGWAAVRAKRRATSGA